MGANKPIQDIEATLLAATKSALHGCITATGIGRTPLPPNVRPSLALPFLHPDCLGELRGQAFGLGLFGEYLAL